MQTPVASCHLFGPDCVALPTRGARRSRLRHPEMRGTGRWSADSRPCGTFLGHVHAQEGFHRRDELIGFLGMFHILTIKIGAPAVTVAESEPGHEEYPDDPL